MQSFNKKFNKTKKSFSKLSEIALKNYTWPGNIRELKNIVERISILQREEVIEVENLPNELQQNKDTSSLEKLACNITKEDREIQLEAVMSSIEKELITFALEKNGNNISQTAKFLNIPRETLRYKITKYELI